MRHHRAAAWFVVLGVVTPSSLAGAQPTPVPEPAAAVPGGSGVPGGGGASGAGGRRSTSQPWAYEVSTPDPWGEEPSASSGVAPGDEKYEHQDSLEPWPATARERQRSRPASWPAGRKRPATKSSVAAAGSWFGYDDGFYARTLDDRFRIVFNSRFEARYSYLDRPEGDRRRAESAFSIPRARLMFSGHVFEPELTYRFQTDFGRGRPSLKDVFFDYAAVPGWLQLRAGQFKRPLARQQINSSVTLQFLERAITNGELGGARDIGLLVHDGYESCPPFEYAVGLFNGTGEDPHLAGTVVVDPVTGEGRIVDGAFSNVPQRFRPEIIARLAYNHGHVDGYREVDFEGGPPRFAVGGSVLVGLDGPEPAEPTVANSGNLLAHLDTILKVEGFTATAGAYLLFVQDGSSFGDQRYDATGFHLQAGYLVFERAQPALRYARVQRAGLGTTHEAGGALSIYFLRTNLAWRTDALMVVEDYPPDWRDSFLVRTQCQLGF